jgi:hypothetical protein
MYVQHLKESSLECAAPVGVSVLVYSMVATYEEDLCYGFSKQLTTFALHYQLLHHACMHVSLVQPFWFGSFIAAPAWQQALPKEDDLRILSSIFPLAPVGNCDQSLVVRTFRGGSFVLSIVQ